MIYRHRHRKLSKRRNGDAATMLENWSTTDAGPLLSLARGELHSAELNGVFLTTAS